MAKKGLREMSKLQLPLLPWSNTLQQLSDLDLELTATVTAVDCGALTRSGLLCSALLCTMSAMSLSWSCWSKVSKSFLKCSN